MDSNIRNSSGDTYEKQETRFFLICITCKVNKIRVSETRNPETRILPYLVRNIKMEGPSVRHFVFELLMERDGHCLSKSFLKNWLCPLFTFFHHASTSSCTHREYKLWKTSPFLLLSCVEIGIGASQSWQWHHILVLSLMFGGMNDIPAFL